MIAVVADASVLVAELLRRRGRDLLRHPELSVFVAQEQWEESQHELGRRLPVLVARARLDEARRRELENEVAGLVADSVLEVVSGERYNHLRAVALRRVPRDERDWPTVAAALALDASILTADAHFLGCGVATWTVETLMAELESGSGRAAPGAQSVPESRAARKAPENSAAIRDRRIARRRGSATSRT